MMKIKRYFVSYAFKNDFGGPLFGNTIVSVDNISLDLCKHLEKQDPQLKDVMIIYFKELKHREFEDAK